MVQAIACTTWQGQRVIVLLCGGDKATQDKDIRAAKRLAKQEE
jgi:putative addiction module killer protein